MTVISQTRQRDNRL